MARRKKIGLIFYYDLNWIGGTYYILNIINALKSLPESAQPFLTIFYNETESLMSIKEIDYKLINYKKIDLYDLNLSQRIINIGSRLLFNKEIFNWRPKNEYDFIFPNPRGYYFELAKNKIYWIPDFQHKYLPELFSENEIFNRNQQIDELIQNSEKIVFSSRNAKGDWKKFYNYAGNETFVVPFAVFQPDISLLNITEVKRKYGIDSRYFIIPNQFWKHKNQIIVLQAINLIKEFLIKNQIIFVFTGKENDPRNLNYFNEFKLVIERNEIQDLILSLGFIDRKDQLLLLKNSIAVIQPSLFEGWSTVVEDAKSLNCRLICSDIEVHKEQAVSKALFFKPNSAESLSQKILEMLSTNDLNNELNYSNNIKEFAYNFLKIY